MRDSVRRLARLVTLLYPPMYRERRGREIHDGLLDAADDESRFRFVTHLASVAIHALRIRYHTATGGDWGETIRQGVVLAVVAVLAGNVIADTGSSTWPGVFFVLMLITGVHVLLGSSAWWQWVIGITLIVVAAKEWSYLGLGELPAIGWISVETLGLVALLVMAGARRTRPWAPTLVLLAAIPTAGMLGSAFHSDTAVIAVMAGVGMLIGLVDPRVAIGTAVGLMLNVTQYTVRHGLDLIDDPSGQLLLPAATASVALALAFIAWSRAQPVNNE